MLFKLLRIRTKQSSFNDDTKRTSKRHYLIDEQKTRQTKNATNQNKECVFVLLTFKSKLYVFLNDQNIIIIKQLSKLINKKKKSANQPIKNM